MKKTEIYLLEDMEDDVYIIRQLLASETAGKYELTVFCQLEELRAGLQQFQPDVLLADLNVPGSEGLETLVKVVNMAPDVPVIVLTNGDEKTLGARSIQLGAQDFIPKAELTAGLLKRALRFAKERHSMMRRLENLVCVDELTLVYNRHFYNDKIRTTIEEAKRYDRAFGLLVLDLDNFKPVNDQFGHAAGDQVLRLIGAKLKDINRSSDFVARYGGDEFVVIVNGVRDKSTLEQVCRNHFRKIKGKYYVEVNGQLEAMQISLSVGAALYPDEATDPDSLFELADKRMYKAKQNQTGTLNDES